MGTIDPEDDEFLMDLGAPRFSGQHPTAEREFCEDFIDFIS
jgi:hypothetical protein